MTKIPIHQIVELTRAELILELLNFNGKFKFDFTPQCLEKFSTEQLRHTLLAAYLHARDENRKSA